MSDESEDIKELRKAIRLHDRQFKQLKDVLNESTVLINQFMIATNGTLKLHEKAIGILSAKQKRMLEGR